MAGLIRARPEWDRFAHWPRAGAIAVLVGFALLLGVASATYPTHFQGRGFKVQPHVPRKVRDKDLALYAAIADRVKKGEDYYRAAMTEQRARFFPVRPGLAVRLPTFAFLSAFAGWGVVAIAEALARRVGHRAASRSAVAGLVLGSAAWQLAAIHPY